MFKGNKKIIYLFLGLTALVLVIQYLLPRPTDWNRNYLNKNKSPFGCYAIYSLLGNTYAPQLEVSKQTLYKLRDQHPAASSLLIINDQAAFDQTDLAALYDLLHKGSTAFIAASEFSGALNDSLHLRLSNPFEFYLPNADSLLKKPGAELRFFFPGRSNRRFRYPGIARFAYFTGFDSSRCTVLAGIDKDRPCLIKTRIGKGTLYLMTAPDVFGNYFIVDHPNREAAYTCLSLIAGKKLIWDEHYKTFAVSNRSPLKFILQNDALYSAWLLLLFILLVYMIFEGRRRQRVIPVISPLQNSTLEFVNVISHVYYSRKSHKAIALEKIKYFYESLRKRFQVDTAEPAEDLYHQLSELSGIDPKTVRQLIRYCEQLKHQEEVTEYELLELNRQLENFNKNSLR